MIARTANIAVKFDFPEHTSKKISDVNKISEVLDFLRNGDYLSISCPEDVAAYLADHGELSRKAALIGFNSKIHSVTSLRDKIFGAAINGNGSTICLIDASCLADYFKGRDPAMLLEWETELETIAMALDCIIVTIHDQRKVNPYIAMTQPFIYDDCSEKFIRNDFALPARHCIKRLQCSDDADWLRTFREYGLSEIVDR